MKKKLKKQKWLLLVDEDDIYDYMIIPKWDTKAHATKIRKGKGYLAGHDCPCKPEIEIDEDGSLTIIHNSFRDIERMKESLKKLSR